MTDSIFPAGAVIEYWYKRDINAANALAGMVEICGMDRYW